MRRVVIAALLAAAAYAHAPTEATAQDKSTSPRPARVGRCVKYDQGASESALRLELRNACGFPVSCNLSWEVRCDADEPGDARVESSELAIDRGETASATASALRCDEADGWTVENVVWTCTKQ